MTPGKHISCRCGQRWVMVDTVKLASLCLETHADTAFHVCTVVQHVESQNEGNVQTGQEGSGASAVYYTVLRSFVFIKILCDL